MHISNNSLSSVDADFAATFASVPDFSEKHLWLHPLQRMKILGYRIIMIVQQGAKIICWMRYCLMWCQLHHARAIFIKNGDFAIFGGGADNN